MIGWYELLQDFQPLIATFVALGAAIIAYLSVQRAAGTQSRTARETTERQIAHALAKEDENELKRRTAFLIMVGSRLRALASSLQRRIGTLEIFCEFARWDEHNVFISDKTDAYWDAVLLLKPLKEESWFYVLKWEDVSMLNSEDQTVLNTIINLIDASDNALADPLETARNHGMVTEGSIRNAVSALRSAAEFLPIAEEVVGGSLKGSIEEHNELRGRMRTAGG